MRRYTYLIIGNLWLVAAVLEANTNPFLATACLAWAIILFRYGKFDYKP